jgi:hypothetical protein
MPKSAKAVLAILVLLVCFTVCPAAPAGDPWAGWDFLLGTWTGEGSGQPGAGSGGFSFQFDLDKNILVRKSQAEYPATPQRAAINHHDLMIIYPAEGGPGTRAVYFDNEGHVINYTVRLAAGGQDLMFIGEPSSTAPRYRLVYTKLDHDTVNAKFEIAPPGKPDAFSTYVEGRSRRTGP